MGKKFVTIKHAAEILNVSVATMRQWDKTGKLRSHRDPKNQYRLYNITELEKFAETTNLPRRGRFITD